MKHRIRKLEEETFGDEPRVSVFQTVYEGENGEPGSGFGMAVIDWGAQKVLTFSTEPGEAQEAFCERMENLKAMAWEDAQQEQRKYEAGK